MPTGLQQLRNGAWSIRWRLIATTPGVQNPVVLFGINQRNVAQGLIEIVGECIDHLSQPAGQPLDGGSTVQLGAEDNVAVIAGIAGAEEVDAQIGVCHVEGWFQGGAHGVLAARPNRIDYPGGGQVIADVHDNLEQRVARQRTHGITLSTTRSKGRSWCV